MFLEEFAAPGDTSLSDATVWDNSQRFWSISEVFRPIPKGQEGDFRVASKVRCEEAHPLSGTLSRPVASLDLVSPGRQLTVSPLFFLKKKLATFYSHRRLHSDDLF